MKHTIHKEHLITAIRQAVKSQERIEKQRGYVWDSAMLECWRKSIDCLENGNELEIK